MENQEVPEDREIKFIGQAAAIGVEGLMETFGLISDSGPWYGDILKDDGTE